LLSVEQVIPISLEGKFPELEGEGEQDLSRAQTQDSQHLK